MQGKRSRSGRRSGTTRAAAPPSEPSTPLTLVCLCGTSIPHTAFVAHSRRCRYSDAANGASGVAEPVSPPMALCDSVATGDDSQSAMVDQAATAWGGAALPNGPWRCGASAYLAHRAAEHAQELAHRSTWSVAEALWFRDVPLDDSAVSSDSAAGTARPAHRQATDAPSARRRVRNDVLRPLPLVTPQTLTDLDHSLAKRIAQAPQRWSVCPPAPSANDDAAGGVRHQEVAAAASPFSGCVSDTFVERGAVRVEQRHASLDGRPDACGGGIHVARLTTRQNNGPHRVALESGATSMAPRHDAETTTTCCPVEPQPTLAAVVLAENPQTDLAYYALVQRTTETRAKWSALYGFENPFADGSRRRHIALLGDLADDLNSASASHPSTPIAPEASGAVRELVASATPLPAADNASSGCAVPRRVRRAYQTLEERDAEPDTIDEGTTPSNSSQCGAAASRTATEGKGATMRDNPVARRHQHRGGPLLERASTHVDVGTTTAVFHWDVWL